MIIASILAFFVAILGGMGYWLYDLNAQIQERIQGQWFLPPVEFYTSGRQLSLGQKITPNEIVQALELMKYRSRRAEDPLRPGDFSLRTAEECEKDEIQVDPILATEEVANKGPCLAFITEDMAFGPARSSEFYVLFWSETGSINGLYRGTDLNSVNQVHLPVEMFAQFYGEEPVLRRLVDLGKVPLACIQALLAIEDNDFLEHKGVSVSGIARAVLRNVMAGGKYSQGGSTITQQLVKNYFLSSEKTLKRKIKELFMAILLESQISKDEILENYLNVIYMGQNGAFQVRGYGAASEHYFRKPLEELNLSECSLLAAIVNSPGLFNPFTQAEKSKLRRDRVLNKMSELQLIDTATALATQKLPLPQRPPSVRLETAPYYVDAVVRKIKELGINLDRGLRIFTPIDRKAQELAQRTVVESLNEIETKNSKVLKIKSEKKKDLEGALLVVDVESGGVQAIVGGRSFKRSQYNRAIISHRQVGSIIKPFVYLTALESNTENGEPYTPLTLIPDKKFTHRERGLTWTPDNYDRKYHGDVPMYYALKNSFNVATAHLALDVGISTVIDVLRRYGVESRLEPFPSLSLGAFELYPWEVAEAYLTIARMGKKRELYWVHSVEDLFGNSLYQHRDEEEEVSRPQVPAQLIGMMKQTLISGTAKWVNKAGFQYPAAGKTGTTSDSKDAWFAGFTPKTLSIAWVGYDDNTPHGLTGASGAVPIWFRFMREFLEAHDPVDFAWPEGVTPTPFTKSQAEELLPPDEAKDEPESQELIL